MTDLLGTDLAFSDDLQVTATGDFDTLSGTDNLRAALLRRILTVPGSLAHRPTYGVGLLAFQNAPLTLAVKRQLLARLAEQLPQDSRVAKVNSVSITSDDATPSTTVIKISVEAVGIGSVQFAYTPFNEVLV